MRCAILSAQLSSIYSEFSTQNLILKFNGKSIEYLTQSVKDKRESIEYLE